MGILVAVSAEIFPVAAVGGIVVVIVIPMVNRQLVKIFPGELARTPPANPRVELQSPFPVIPLTLFALASRLGHDPIQLSGIRWCFLRWHLLSRDKIKCDCGALCWASQAQPNMPH